MYLIACTLALCVPWPMTGMRVSHKQKASSNAHVHQQMLPAAIVSAVLLSVSAPCNRYTRFRAHQETQTNYLAMTAWRMRLATFTPSTPMPIHNSRQTCS